MEIAIIGAGAAGLSAAARLQRRHSITLFERAPRCGGHAWTVRVPDGGRELAVDLGFMVFNEGNYPRFVRLLEEHGGIERGDSEMSFSYCDRASGESYVINLDPSPRGAAAGETPVPSALLPILGEVMRFVRQAAADLERDAIGEQTLGEYLEAGGFSRRLQDLYVLPMGAALWSAPPQRIRAFPARSYLSFFRNHGLLSPVSGLHWQHVRGGSERYVGAVVAKLRGEVRTGAEVLSVTRTGDGVVVAMAGAEPRRFDAAVLAVHADQALRLLQDADDVERAFLGAFSYQRNHAVLHTDASVMPPTGAHWGSWNFEREAGNAADRPVCVSYHLNRLQGLAGAARDWFVTLNRSAPVDASQVHLRMEFDHPIFDNAAIRAQSSDIARAGRNRVHFCGAHLGFGFHEDAVRSGAAVAQALGVEDAA